MSKLMRILIVGLAATALRASERSSFNLRVPGGLEPGEAVFSVQHRFLGRITDDPLGTALGMNAGASVGAALRTRIWSNLELYCGYALFKEEITAGAGYVLPLPEAVRAELAVEYFDYEEPLITPRRRNLFYQGLVQAAPIGGHLAPALNLCYDGYNLQPGAGLGLDWGFSFEFGPFDGFNLVAEYFPTFLSDTAVTGPANSLAFGIKFNTYGHHFMFIVGNNTAIGTRRAMLGAAANDLYFGFNINRFLKP